MKRTPIQYRNIEKIETATRRDLATERPKWRDISPDIRSVGHDESGSPFRSNSAVFVSTLQNVPADAYAVVPPFS